MGEQSDGMTKARAMIAGGQPKECEVFRSYVLAGKICEVHEEMRAHGA